MSKSNTVQNGKGSKDRVKNRKVYNDNYDLIDWKKKDEKIKIQKREEK